MASPITSPTFLLPSPYSLNDKKFISILRPFRIAPIFFRLIYPRIYNLPRREGGLKGIEKEREREKTRKTRILHSLQSRCDRQRKKEREKEGGEKRKGREEEKVTLPPLPFDVPYHNRARNYRTKGFRRM